MAEEVLIGDGGDGRGLRLDGQPFFRFQRLMRAVAHAATGLRAACQLVDEHDLTTLHHVVLILVEQAMGAQGRHDVVQQANVLRLVKAAILTQQTTPAQNHFKLWHTFFGELDVAGLFIDRIGFFGQFLRNQVSRAEDVGDIDRRTRHDQRRPGFVNQNRVSLIHDHKIEAPLNHVSPGWLHLIAQVVKTDFRCNRVSYISAIAAPLGVIDLARRQNPAIQPHARRHVTRGQA